MRLLADLHVHTVSSGHAYSTVQEMASAAGARGLELIAITDHGPRCPGGAHLYHFWNMRVLPPVLSGVRVLHGVEANILEGGALDVPDEILAMLDVVAFGFHPEAGFDEPDEARNTEVMLQAMENPLVDVVTHPGNPKYPVKVETIVEAAARHGVALELNAHSFHPHSSRSFSNRLEREFAAAALEAGVSVSIGSDAHFHDRVGVFDGAVETAQQLGFNPSDILNRDAASVTGFLKSRRPRPYMNVAAEEGVD